MQQKAGLWLLAASMCFAAGCGNNRGGDAPSDDRDVNEGTDGGSGDAASGGSDSGNEGVDDIEGIVTLIANKQVNLLLGGSTAVEFEVPVGTVSLSVVIQGDSDTTYTIERWVDGAGKELVYEDWISAGQQAEPQAPAICVNCNNRMAGAEGAFGSIAPISPDGVFDSGTHSIELFGYILDQSDFLNAAVQPVTGTANLTIYAKVVEEEAVENGILDVNIHFTGAGGWTAENAPNDAEFQAVLDEVDSIYQGVNIELGTIRYFDIDENFRSIESISGAGNDLATMFASVEHSADENALNLFLVEELKQGGPFGDFGVLLGIAGGIPGPTLTQGSDRSGVAVAVESHDDPNIPAALHTTIAHEMGHFLGLFHTSEQDLGSIFGIPQLHDPLPDTPENDASYLMFNTGEGPNLSEWQGRVMRSNPWVRHDGGDA